MRAIFIFYILCIFLISGCASVEVAKEVTKATQSIETSVKKLLKNNRAKKTGTQESIEKQKIAEDENKKQKILVEKKEISEDQEKISKVITKQKKFSSINLLGKNIQELNVYFGNPALTRQDGKIITLRYDSDFCRLFVFINSSSNSKNVQYYELRNVKGVLIENNKDIESCFNKMNIG